MNILEILGLVWISIIVYNAFMVYKQVRKERMEQYILPESQTNREFAIKVEYIQEHKTFYAYMEKTGKFLAQGTTTEELGAKLGKMLPKNAQLIVTKVEEVGRYHEKS